MSLSNEMLIGLVISVATATGIYHYVEKREKKKRNKDEAMIFFHAIMSAQVFLLFAEVGLLCFFEEMKHAIQ